jgi:hypothetical protein
MPVTNKDTLKFPAQKQKDSKKTEKWIKECIEAAEQIALFREERIRETHENKVVNYNLANDILDQKDIQRVCNPFNLRVTEFPAKMQNYPVAAPKMDLLNGEEWKRRFDWRVRIINDSAISEKEELLNDQFNQLVQELVTSSVSPEEVEARLKKFDKYRNYTFQDKRELSMTRILKYLWQKERLAEKFNRGFQDVLIAGEEIYATDIVAGEPILEKWNPLNVFTIGSGESPYIEDSDVIVHTSYISAGQAIDEFYEHLTPKEIDAIEDGSGTTNKPSAGGAQILHYNTDWPTLTTETTRLTDLPLEPVTLKTIRALTGAFDEYGNIRKTHVRWRSRRKMIEVEYVDANGEVQKDLYDENYKPQNRAGEKAKTIWVNEWWEGTRLGLDIFVKMGPREVQFNSLTNLSKCMPGVVGTAFNINDSKARSLMDVMKPYQYLYNTFMYRTELAFAKNYGKIANLDLSRIPDDWDLDKWFHYAVNMGFAPIDNFKEGKRGAATGKLAGNMSQGPAVMDLSLGNYINQHVSMLQYIEQQLGEIAGVTKQRQGQVSSSELVGNVERAVTQSSHITEKWFKVHDNVKKRVLEALMETAKAAWRNDKRKLQYVSDEMTTVTFEVDGALINEAEYGLFITDAQKDTQLFETLKSLAQAGIQNDKINFSTLMDIYHADSITEVRRRIEQGEEEQEQKRQEELQQAQQMQQQQIEAQQQAAQAEQQMKEQHNLRDNETKVRVAEINAASKLSDVDNDTNDNGVRDEIDIQKLSMQQQKMDQDFQIQQAKIEEDKRKNRKKEELEEKKIAASKQKQNSNQK